MDFLSGYDSHSDSDDEVSKEVKAISQDQEVTIQSKNVLHSKTITCIQPEKKAKKKKFNISILPTEIQHALAQTDYLLDSDEETDNMKINSNKKQAELSSSSILPPSASDSTTMKELMRLLPKPSVAAASDDYFTVAKKALVLKPISARTSSSVSIKTSEVTQEKLKSAFSFATTTTTTVTNPSSMNKVKVNNLVPTVQSNLKTEGAVESDEDDGDEDYCHHVAKPRDLFSSSSSVSSSSSMFTFANKSSSAPVPPHVNTTASASSIGNNYFDTSTYSHPTSFYAYTAADSLNVSYPLPQPQPLVLSETSSSNNVSYDTLYAPQGQNYPSVYDDHQHNPKNYYVQGYAEVEDSSSSYRTDAVANNPTSISTNKRRRDREIEQAFLSGQISDVSDAAEKFGININQTKCIDGVGKEWDSSKYNEQKRLQAEVQHAFHLSGDAIASGGAGQPSKQQARKHQINSLAFQAAKTQLALLETKGARMKTKHETQSKYGW